MSSFGRGGQAMVVFEMSSWLARKAIRNFECAGVVCKSGESLVSR